MKFKPVIRLINFALAWLLAAAAIAAEPGIQSAGDGLAIQKLDHPLIQTIKQFQLAKAKRSKTAQRFIAAEARIWYDKKEGAGSPYQLASRWSRWDEFFKAQRTFKGWQVEGNAVSVTIVETNDYYRLTERSAWPVKLTWWLSDERKIIGVFVRPATGETPKSRIGEFQQWAGEHHPEELNYLMPEGNVNPEGDRPERIKALLIKWRAAVGLPPLTK